MKLKGKKDILIVIPGPKSIKYPAKSMEKFASALYFQLNVKNPVFKNYAKYYAAKLDGPSREAIWLHWDRKMTPLSRLDAVRKLRKIIREYGKKYNVKIVGISFGAALAVQAAKKLEESLIKKMILICPIIEDKNIQFEKIKVYNLYSKHDSFAKFSTKLISPFKGDVTGSNIINIEIPDFGHDDFCTDNKIKKGRFKGKWLSEVITYFIDLK